MAFVMARDLAGPGVTVADALTAVAGVLPAIEVVDSRIADWRITLVDTVADNACRPAGPRWHAHPGHGARPAADRDAVLSQRGADRERRGGGGAGNPARCVAWLANKLGGLGSGLRRGDIVLPARCTGWPVRPGDVFRAAFAHLGSVTARFPGGPMTRPAGDRPTP